MLPEILPYLLLILGFSAVIKGADLFVEGASDIAKRLGVSELVIGLTIVAFGTSAPELAVNVLAAFGGSTDLAIGNIFGSNFTNILLILGISALIAPLVVNKKILHIDIPFMVLVMAMAVVLANDMLLSRASESTIANGDALVLLGFLCVFFVYMLRSAQSENDTGMQGKPRYSSTLVATRVFLVGLAGLVLGGNWVVSGATTIAKTFGLSDTFIGLTIVAIGTSISELVASAVAAMRWKADIAIGNVVGSNILNTVFVLPLTALTASAPIAFDMSSNIDALVMISAGILLGISLIIGQKRVIDRWAGVIFVCLYFAYMGVLIYRNVG